jgi:hypothetical protein
MHIEFSDDEIKTLKKTLDRAIYDTERELVRTDAPTMQHELNADFRRLQQIRGRLDEASSFGGESLRRTG